MQFEILNTIKFLLFVIVMAFAYYKFKKSGAIKTSWKTFFLLMLFFAAITYTQFFTLTEKTDVLNTQKVMLNQSSHVSNGKTIAKYLDENKPVARIPTHKENSEDLAEQQAKSKELAKQIENKQGDK